jgi:hypothetical protein
VTAVGRSKTAAEQALLKKLQDRAKTSRSGELTAMHKINHLLDLWDQRFEALIADGKRSPTSLDTYRRALKNHVRPALGELRIGEATTPRIDTVLAKIKTTAGPCTAKTRRAIVSGHYSSFPGDPRGSLPCGSDRRCQLGDDRGRCEHAERDTDGRAKAPKELDRSGRPEVVASHNGTQRLSP